MTDSWLTMTVTHNIGKIFTIVYVDDALVLLAEPREQFVVFDFCLL